MKKRRVLNTIAAIGMLLGGSLFIGTLGAVECERIGATQAIVQGLISVGLALLGGRVFAVTYDPTEYEEDDYE